MNPAVSAAVASLQAELETAVDSVGAVFFGSAQRGQLAPNSDLDFYAIHSGNQQWHEGRLSHGQVLEISFAPVRFLRGLLLAHNPTVTHALASGEILFDRTGEVAALVVEARARWASGPPAADEGAREGWRFRLTDLVFDLRDLGGDGPDAAAVAALLVQCAIAAASACQGRWPPPRKGMLQALRRDHPALAPLVVSYHASPSTTAALQLGERVLDELGGPLVEYTSQRRDC